MTAYSNKSKMFVSQVNLGSTFFKMITFQTIGDYSLILSDGDLFTKKKRREEDNDKKKRDLNFKNQKTGSGNPPHYIIGDS